MNILTSNFHTHTDRCLHAYGKEKDYVKAAVNAGLDILGFSDHAPFMDKDYGLRMKYDELPEYVSEIDKLKKEYFGKIKLYTGLEIEYHPQYDDYYPYLLKNMGVEYLALGEHMYTIGGNIKNIFFAEKTEDYINCAHCISQAADTGFFSFIAHPDIMFINDFAWDKNCDKACDIILSAAERNDLPLEFNANGIRRGIRQFPDEKRLPYPHDNFWRQLSGSKQKVLIGADCHTPEQLNDSAMKIAARMCEGLKLNVIDSLME